MKNKSFEIVFVEVNQHTPIEIRERLNYHSTELKLIIESLRDEPILLEKLFLCTCNRSLLIFICHKENLNNAKKRSLELFDLWAKIHISEQYIQFYTGRNALSRLVRLAVGMESPIFGEDQILGQIKLFFGIFLKHKLTGPILNRVFQQLQFIARKIKRKIPISRGRLSLSGLVIQEVEGFIKKTGQDKLQVLIIGWGEITATIFKILNSMKEIEKISVANRTLNKVNVSCDKLKIDKVVEIAKYFDIIVSMTSRFGYVVNSDCFRDGVERDMLLVDLGVPRNIDPHLAKISLVKLVNIDTLNLKTIKNIRGRKQQIPQAQVYISGFQDKMIKFIENYQKQQNIVQILKQAKSVYIHDRKLFFRTISPKKSKQIVNSFCKKTYREIITQ
ncbi:MAG: glutamyl-tRNA reductase [Parcubacteria group bacterium LiPW_30]|nr:MAG: glutamyl-tRNA reductase [Parcubacteria group bacterium LiPW_30]